MRSMLTATLMFVVAATSAPAQMTAPASGGAKPKQVTTVPIRPALQSPADTANAMAQAEQRLQPVNPAELVVQHAYVAGLCPNPQDGLFPRGHVHGAGQATGHESLGDQACVREVARHQQDDRPLAHRAALPPAARRMTDQ